MANLKQFRDLVTTYRKPYTQKELAAAINLPANELSHRLGGTGRQALTQENVLDIVVTLAKWQALNWDQAVELLRLMDYPLDTLQWKTRLQEHLSPPELALSPTPKRTPSAVVPDAPEGKQQLPSGRRRLFQARDLPRGYVARPEPFQKLKQLLLNQQDGQAAAITTALRGAGGFGKTTLAIALCHDHEIQAAFPDGILWVELGEYPHLLDVLNGVLHSFDASLSGAITLEEARGRWRSMLDGRVCLLVIDDAWQAEALEPLLEGGPQCKRLITTRNDLLLPEEIPSEARIWVDAMEPEEAINLLCQGWEEQIEPVAYHPQLLDLVTLLGRWPLLLTLAGGMLATRLREGKNAVQAFSIVKQAYQKRGVVAFHLASKSERQRTVDACLEVSLRHLEVFAPPHYHATTRYQHLAIFPENTDIPLSTLHIYWQGAEEWEMWETEDLCSRLHGLSLLTHDVKRGTIRLHDVLRSYLIMRAGADLPAFHSHLLDAYEQVLGLTRWADLPRDEKYLWRHLIEHLCKAGHGEVLRATLSDLDYLIHKVLFVGIPALEADLLQAHEYEPSDPAEPLLSPIAFLHQTIGHLSHLLRQVHTPAEVGGLLLSCLRSGTPFEVQRPMLEQALPRPLLIASHSLLSKSSSALIRTLRGHSFTVNGCAISPDGQWIVSASSDGTLKVWELATGAERFTLFGHTDSVDGCAISPDGQWIVSASSDGTLKVWELATKVENFTPSNHTGSVIDCAISPDGTFVVSTSRDGTLKVWELATGTERFTFSGHAFWVSGCAISPDGQWIVSASHDGTLKVWELATGADRFALSGHTGSVMDCAISADGTLVVSTSNDGTLKVWELATGTERFTLHVHTSLMDRCAISPDGQWIVSAFLDGTLKVWELATGADRFTLSGHTEWARKFAISPDSRWIVSASLDGMLKVWELATGADRFTLSGHTGSVMDCAISPDGQWIVSASSDGTLKVWEVATGADRFTLSGHIDSVDGCAISPDGQWIVSASSDGTLKVWEAQTGHCVLTFPVDEALLGCVISPHGEFLVTWGHQRIYFLRLVV